MAKQAVYKDSPIDILGSRITQLRGVMNAIQNSYDDETLTYNMPDRYLYDAVWAVIELIDQANAAFGAMIKEQNKEQDRKPKSKEGGTP